MKLTTREKDLLFACAFIGIIVAIWIQLIQPYWLELQSEKVQLVKLQTYLKEVKDYQKQGDREKAVLESKILEIDRKLPNTFESAEMLYFINKAANNVNPKVTLVQYEVDAENTVTDPSNGASTNTTVPKPQDQGQKRVTVKIKAIGTYKQVLQFITKLEEIPRAVWVQKGELKKTEKYIKYGICEANLTIYGYALPQKRGYQNNVLPKLDAPKSLLSAPKYI